MKKNLASEVVDCNLCFLRYNQENLCPRSLSCGHTFCSSCLQRLLKDGSIKCPKDQKSNQVTGNVNSLPVNIPVLQDLFGNEVGIRNVPLTYCEVCEGPQHIANSKCLDCGQAMCQGMAKAHALMRASKSHAILSLMEINKDPTIASKPAICPEHQESYGFFDNKCKRVICAQCVTSNHCGHECVNIMVAAKQCREEVPSKCNELNRKEEQAKTDCQKLTQLLHLLEQHYQRADTSTEEAFKQVLQSISTRKDALKGELKRIYDRKSAKLSEQMEQLRKVRTSYVDALNEVTHACQSRNDLNKLLAYTDINDIVAATDATVGERAPCADGALNCSIDTKSIVGMVPSFGSIRT